MLQINPTLAHQPFTMPAGIQNPSLLSWNIRELPSTFLRLTSVPGRNLTQTELAGPATRPPVTRLRIFCGIFLDPDLDLSSSWGIEARNQHGVTVKDVLTAIYEAFQEPYTHEEFNRLCAKTQTRVLEAYEARVQANADPSMTWGAGVRRADRLMKHSWFGGLSILFSSEDSPPTDLAPCHLILSLRVGDEPTLISPTRIVSMPFR